MHILLTNDDGISSQQLALLCRAAAARGHEVSVCAPATQQSAKAQSFAVFEPITVEKSAMFGAFEAWAIHGTPADCARLGLMQLCEKKVDLVISGINYGYNAGLAVYVSGTVGAAREASFHHVPAMALSAEVGVPEETLRFFADWAITVAERFVTYPKPEMTVCNINLPPVPMHELKAPVMCGLSHHVYQFEYVRREKPRGGTYFWAMPDDVDNRPEPGSDVDHLHQGHITCSFLTPEGGVDQASYSDFLTDL